MTDYYIDFITNPVFIVLVLYVVLFALFLTFGGKKHV